MRRIVVVVVMAGALGLGVFGWLVRPQLTAAERGRRLAERVGCFGCHGPEGTRGIPNPGSPDKTVPNFTDDVMMFAESPAEIREWIRDGVSEKHAHSHTFQENRERGTLKMPAFKRRLDRRQIEDLVAYVVAMSADAPGDPVAARGAERAEALGCFGCHGAGGRLARPNRGSLKSYVPAWDGADFRELVRDRGEFGQWVEHGASDRFRRSATAQFFLRRGALRMPAFERQIEPADIDTLWRYVQWLRSRSQAR